MVIKDGRFGPYVTDGETNASLRKGDEVEKITDERASELLAERRAEGAGAEEGARAPGPGREEGTGQEGAGPQGPAKYAGEGRRTACAMSAGSLSTTGRHRGERTGHLQPGTTRISASSSALTAAATRPPSARPAAAALACFMTWPICRGPGCSPSSAAMSADGGGRSRPARRR